MNQWTGSGQWPHSTAPPPGPTAQRSGRWLIKPFNLLHHKRQRCTGGGGTRRVHGHVQKGHLACMEPFHIYRNGKLQYQLQYCEGPAQSIDQSMCPIIAAKTCRKGGGGASLRQLQACQPHTDMCMHDTCRLPQASCLHDHRDLPAPPPPPFHTHTFTSGPWLADPSNKLTDYGMLRMQ